MKSGRRMRTAYKMRRIYTLTVMAWALALVVFWLVGAVHSIGSTEVSDFSNFDPGNVGQYLIYFVLLVFVLIAVLLLEYLIFGRKRSGSGQAGAAATYVNTNISKPAAHSSPVKTQTGTKRPNSRRRSPVPGLRNSKDRLTLWGRFTGWFVD